MAASRRPCPGEWSTSAVPAYRPRTARTWCCAFSTGRKASCRSTSSACDERCRTKLVYMRQVRLAQAKESERIERVWILTDSGVPDPRLIETHPGLHVLRARSGDAVKALPAP